ncbi:hypothetical protein J2S74_002705 [Evansella vedderi]|uniref:Uncharacterized protein n=1 Tax=Evansella vedderi TaxID=38282 RepID=A0ABT9ZXW4_9BACI|nr:hypothetical protein [Evansella vedderi]MDQ0255323.1 hypothetical protein [Evansella vedderi]
MFVKVTPRKRGDKTYYYAELVESYRENGKTKHRHIFYFGSVDKVKAQKLKIAFSKDFDAYTNIDKVDFSKSVPYGDYYLLDSICNQIGMFQDFSKIIHINGSSYYCTNSRRLHKRSCVSTYFAT